MTESRNLQPLWDQLVGEDLSGIVFVRDYLQLQFNPPPQLNVYSSHVVASAEGRSAKFGEEAFADLALGLIGRFLREVRVDGQSSSLLKQIQLEENTPARLQLFRRVIHRKWPVIIDKPGLTGSCARASGSSSQQELLS